MTITLERPPKQPNKPAEIEYPTSDGKPMAETDVHRQLMSDHIAMLDARYENERLRAELEALRRQSQ